MLIDKHIGRNSKGEEGIMGNQVSREVFALKNAGVKELDVWINSGGGNMFEGMSIYSTLKDCGLKINTFNKGIVDSVAGWVFQSGTKRTWSNYGLGLIHNVQGAGPEQEDTVNTSIATMYSGKTNRTPEEVKALMAEDKLMDATLAKQYGFCDEVTNCSDLTQLTNNSDISQVAEFGNKEIIKTLPKIKTMSVLNQILGLQNEANEESRIAAINVILSEKKTAEAKVLELTNSSTTLTTTLASTTESLTTANAKLLQMENDSKQTKAEALVKEHVGKRIPNEPTVIANWTNQAVVNYDATKLLIESLNLNVTAPDPLQNPANKPDPNIILSAAQYSAA